MNKIKFNKNVKFDKERYSKGDSLSVSKDDYDLLLEAKVIDTLEDAEWPEQEETETPEDTDIDLFTLSKEELDKINKSVITEFLNKEEVEFNSKATKDELIALIVGE